MAKMFLELINEIIHHRRKTHHRRKKVKSHINRLWETAEHQNQKEEFKITKEEKQMTYKGLTI